MRDGLRQNKIVRVGKNSGPVLNRLWTKIHEILGQRRRPFVLSNALVWLSNVYVTFRSADIRHKVSKSSNNRTNVKAFWPPFFSGGMTPTFLQHIVSVSYLPPFDKVRLSSVCWSLSAQPGNEVQCGIYGRWVKTTVQFELWISLWTKVYVVLRRYRRPL